MDANSTNDTPLPTPATEALLSAPAPDVLLAPAPNPLQLPASLGTVEVLTEAEWINFQTCETVIGMGWQAFVDVGLALKQIRDERLYRVDFDSFEAYCLKKWAYGRRQVDRIICAAEVVKQLRPNWSHCLPENESQLRPLFGLTPEQIQLAWQRAVERAGGRGISARLVKCAVRELKFTNVATPVPRQGRPNKAERRRLIDNAIGELLVLLRQDAARQVLIEKVEALHHQIYSILDT